MNSITASDAHPHSHPSIQLTPLKFRRNTLTSTLQPCLSHVCLTARKMDSEPIHQPAGVVYSESVTARLSGHTQLRHTQQTRPFSFQGLKL